jgi:biofilm PGA synthesis protein PgaD
MRSDTHDATIHVGSLLTARQKFSDSVLTTLLWITYGYLWLPFISLVAWWVGIDSAYETIENAGGINHLLELVLWFGTAICIMAAIVIGWSLSQLLQFKDKNRRTQIPNLKMDAERSFWHLDEDTFRQIRDGCRLTVDLDENGAIIAVSEVAT